jgi:hypothetical protein
MEQPVWLRRRHWHGGHGEPSLSLSVCLCVCVSVCRLPLKKNWFQSGSHMRAHTVLFVTAHTNRGNTTPSIEPPLRLRATLRLKSATLPRSSAPASKRRRRSRRRRRRHNKASTKTTTGSVRVCQSIHHGRWRRLMEKGGTYRGSKGRSALAR